MQLINTSLIHPDFKLNGKYYLGINDLLTTIKTLDNDSYLFLCQWFNNNNYVTINTSGSTGKPKQIQLQKKAMVASALVTADYFELPNKTKAFLCLSTTFIAGKMMLLRALINGWELDILPTNSSPLSGNTKKYDFGAMVPLQVQHSLKDLGLVSKIIIGGGAINNTLLAQIYTLKTQCFATYGMTETITHIAAKELIKNIKYYTVLPDISISSDSSNRLVIKAPHLSENTITTNDIVNIINTKQFEWLGRYDNIINSGSYKIVPEQVEAALSKHICVPFFVASIPDELLENKLIIVIESKPYNLEIDTTNTELHKYQTPKSFYFLDQFIYTETKKIQRQKTLDLLKF